MGYSQRFGLTWVDFETQERFKKIPIITTKILSRTDRQKVRKSDCSKLIFVRFVDRRARSRFQDLWIAKVVRGYWFSLLHPVFHQL